MADPAHGQQYIWENTYRMAPQAHETFYPSVITEIAKEVVENYFKGNDIQNYDDDMSKTWAVEITEEIKAAVKAKGNIPRHKIVVQVVIGQNDHQGVRVASKCLWDTKHDNYATATFVNKSLHCTAMVFGLYYE